jgi:hypothetical protein
MKVYTSEVKRSPWAKPVTVSRTRNGRWIIDRVIAKTELPANTFSCWEHAEWTGNAWANTELLETQ